MNATKNNATSLSLVQQSLIDNLPFEPTQSQSRAIYVLARFLVSRQSRCTFLLKGYAGTGKTSLMKALVSHQHAVGEQVALLAPTGRAAKVLGSYTGAAAYTIHRHIYQRSIDSTGRSKYMLRPNKRKRTVFIVDEASMLSDNRGMVGDDLLADLISFVYNGEGSRLILLGDNAQLPPVGMSESLALDIDHLRSTYDLTIAEHTLDEVVRQAEGSAILKLATAIRERVFAETEDENHETPQVEGPEVIYLPPVDLPDTLETAYDKYGREDVRVICRSNKSANLFNLQIRNQVFQMDDELSAGEMLMVVRNNYLWAEADENLPFIANGEMCEVKYVKTHRDLYDLRFATLGLDFVDQQAQMTIECNVLLDTLQVASASMSEDAMSTLYQAVKEDLSYENGAAAVQAKLRKDPWLHALQVKYGYAVTCHKAQGGQWPVVFIDRGFIPEGGINKEYWRWLYTAVTRATERVYLVGF